MTHTYSLTIKQSERNWSTLISMTQLKVFHLLTCRDDGTLPPPPPGGSCWWSKSFVALPRLIPELMVGIPPPPPPWPPGPPAIMADDRRVFSRRSDEDTLAAAPLWRRTDTRRSRSARDNGRGDVAGIESHRHLITNNLKHKVLFGYCTISFYQNNFTAIKKISNCIKYSCLIIPKI